MACLANSAGGRSILEFPLSTVLADGVGAKQDQWSVGWGVVKTAGHTLVKTISGLWK